VEVGGNGVFVTRGRSEAVIVGVRVGAKVCVGVWVGAEVRVAVAVGVGVAVGGDVLVGTNVAEGRPWMLSGDAGVSVSRLGWVERGVQAEMRSASTSQPKLGQGLYLR